MVFVRKFLRLKRKLCLGDDVTGFKEWSQALLKEASGVRVDGDDGDDPPSGDDNDATPDDRVDDVNDVVIFQDRIEPGEMGKVNGKEPGRPRVPLTQLKKDNAAKSWLFMKYYNKHFVDKNPCGAESDDEASDEGEWEHRVIKNIVWWRRNGYAVETCLKDSPVDSQSIERYIINDTLIDMIRASPHNTGIIMASTQPATATVTEPPTSLDNERGTVPVV